MSSGHVLVVDDDASVRRMLVRLLDAEGFAVEAVADGGLALAAVERSAPDAIVLDVGLPGMDGLAVCRRLRAKGLATPILMLTARDAVADRVTGLETGADDYLVKPFAAEELVARLHALARRGTTDGDTVSGAGMTLRRSARSVTRAGREIGLTDRETALLALLLRHPGQVVTRSQALDDIWEDEASDNVVDRYVGRLRAKLGAPSVIHTIRGVGFLLQA